MPPTSDASSGSLTGPPLWTLTAVLIAVAGILFFFVSEPLASAFDLLLPSSLIDEGEAEPEVPMPVVETEPEEPPPPPPKIWTPAEIDAGMAELATTLPALIDAARSEMPTYEDLASTDDANAQRATARWGRWGNVWHNRVDAERAKLPPRGQCRPHDDLRDGCVELHSILDDLEAIKDATEYGDAELRVDAVAARLDLYLNPPPPPEEPKDDSLDVAESP